MSNQEEADLLAGIQLPGEVFETPDDRIIGLNNDNGLKSKEEIKAIIENEPVIPKFKPKVPKSPVENKVTVEPVVAAAQNSTSEEDEVRILKQKIYDMEQAVKLLVTGRDGVKLAMQKPVKPIDWSKAKEADIFDMDVPIEVVGHELPDYMKVELKDSNFVPRWVQKMSRRLGPMKAKGYTFVKPEEIEGELNIAIEADENGVFRHDDVILMKIEKRTYYGMLRRNHMKALQMTDPKAAHKVAQDRIISDMQTARAEDRPAGTAPDTTRPGDFERYAEKNKLEVYI